jgi:hypothetical protein
MTHHPKEYGTGVNHRILPTFVKNLRVSEGMEDVNEYIENHYPDFGPIAYEDLVGLTEHVQSVFKNAGYDA